MIPVVGLGSMSDIFQRIAEERHWDARQDQANKPSSDAEDESARLRLQSIADWHELMQLLRKPFASISNTIDQGLEHVTITLQLAKRQRERSADDSAENAGSEPLPGDEGFLTYFDGQSRSFLESRRHMLSDWCALHGIHLDPKFFTDPNAADLEAPDWMNNPTSSEHRRLRRQLFLCLYMEHLLYQISRRTYDMMVAAEGLIASGKLSRWRLIVPGSKRLRKWFMSIFDADQSAHDDQQIDSGMNGVTVYLGQAYDQKKDPDHLPPQNPWERVSNYVRIIPRFFASPSASFGLRVAVATMCIAVIAYLRNTQAFFTTQRLFWAQIMVRRPTDKHSVLERHMN